MGDVITNKDMDWVSFFFRKTDNEEGKDAFLKPSMESEDINSSYSNSPYEYSPEDSGGFYNNVYKGKETILNEHWEVNESIQGKILKSNEKEVFVDCLIDFDAKIIQSRKFPIILFQNLSEIVPNKPVLIKTKTMKGSIRIDVYSGEGIVNLDVFEFNDKWDSLRGKKLDSKLAKW
jgi:hypothetical protein